MYTVRAGDTMSAISRRHGISLQELLKANPQVSNANVIRIGQSLNIPGQRDEFEAPRPTSSGTSLLRGMEGPAVEQLQRNLVRLGYLTEAQLATGPGVFGPRTDAAVRAFQRANGLEVDGVAGPITQRAIAERLAGGRPTPAPAPQPEPTGQYDGSKPASGVTRTDAWNAVTAPVQSWPGQRSAGQYAQVLNQFAVGVNPRYQPRNGNTYCNIFVWDATKAMNAEIPHWVNGRELNANGVVDWLHNNGATNGWRRVSAEEAQQSANGGHPAVAVWKNPGGIGHVAMVRPGEITSAGPASAQAGGRNFNRGHVADGFGSRQPEYWVHD